MNNVQEKKRDDNYKNHFYMDYFGSALRSNGKRYKHSDISEISKLGTSSTASVYGVVTNTGIRGVLRLYSNAPNYNTSISFIEKCMENKTDSE